MLKNAQLIIALLNDAEYCSCAFFPENYSNGRNGISQKRIWETKCKQVWEYLHYGLTRLRSDTNMCLSWVPSRRHLTVTGDNWRYLYDEKCRFLETSFMTFTLYKHIIMKSELNLSFKQCPAQRKRIFDFCKYQCLWDLIKYKLKVKNENIGSVKSFVNEKKMTLSIL